MSGRPLLLDEGVDACGIIPPPDDTEEEIPTEYVAETGPHESTRRHHVALVLAHIVLILERTGYYSLAYNLDMIVEYDYFITYGVEAGGQFIFPLIGAWFGECLFGVHTTAVFGTVLELIGSALLAASTWIQYYQPQPSLALAGLILVMLGLALTRPNYAMKAASQIPERELIEKGFFQWYIIAINVAEALAICSLLLPRRVQCVCWPACLFAALMVLLVVKCTSHRELNYTSRKGFRRLLECFSGSSSQTDNSLSLLKKHMITIFLFIGMQVPYFIAYNTLHSEIISYNIANDSSELLIYAYEPLSLIIVVLLNSFVLTPILNRYSLPTMNSIKCVAVGMTLVIVSCIIAAIRDIYGEKTDLWVHTWADIASRFPQFFVLGISAALCKIKVFEFVYMETPKHLKTQMIGLYLTVIGMGYGFSILSVVAWLTYSAPVWSVWGVICCINLLLGVVPFVVFFRRYEYRRDRERSVSAAVDGRRRPLFGGSELDDSEELEEENDCCCC